MRAVLATLKLMAIAQMIHSAVLFTVPEGAVRMPMGNDRMISALPQDLQALFRRSSVVRPFVEAGPGFFKSDPVEYSPDRLAKEYKKLFAIKKRMEEENKPLNPLLTFI